MRHTHLRGPLVIFLGLALLACLGWGTPAGAQQDSQYRAMRPGVTVDLTVRRSDPTADINAGDAVDTTLLRAYASRFDYHKVDEETRRLKEMHPGWTPPTDLFAPKAAAVDERGLWTSWERGDLAAVDREVAILRSLNPGWTPPQKLTELVDARRMRDACVRHAIPPPAAALQFTLHHPVTAAVIGLAPRKRPRLTSRTCRCPYRARCGPSWTGHAGAKSFPGDTQPVRGLRAAQGRQDGPGDGGTGCCECSQPYSPTRPE